MSANGERPLALVTGASSGVGLKLARVFAQNGFEALTSGEGRVVAHSPVPTAQAPASRALRARSR